VRLLTLSNFYPPHSRGGYEQWCHEVTERLRARGHEVEVLTSRFAGAGVVERDAPWVHRDLRLEMEFDSLWNAARFFTARHADRRKNLERLRTLIRAFKPECVLVWGMWNLHRSLPALAEHACPNRVAYYVGDYWPTLPTQYEPYWESPARGWMASILKAPLRVVARRLIAREHVPDVEFRHLMFPTSFMRDELSRRGIRGTVSRIVSGAIDISLYVPLTERDRGSDPDPVRLLWAGRLTSEKGVDDAIVALGILLHESHISRVRLTVVGSGEASYERHLRALAQQHGVGDLVTFLGAQPKEVMPELYGEADIFLFTSTWPEPFGRVIVEAMASQLAVVGSATGGAAEILVDGRNALVVKPGDARDLAGAVGRLVDSPRLREQLAQRARQDAVEQFDVERMTTGIEDFLREMAAGRLEPGGREAGIAIDRGGVRNPGNPAIMRSDGVGLASRPT
jgi:glycosyltransferase involved in cell wall biosynthesis